MTSARTLDLLNEISPRQSGLAAFNAITFEQAEAIVEGAAAAGTPVVLQVSQNAIRWHGAFAPFLAACRELAHDAPEPVGIHVDHLDDENLAREILADAARLGVGSLMFDASALPYGENVAATSRVVRLAHGAGLAVEGELGEIGGKLGAHASGARTDPGGAVSFVAQTSVDLLAVAVGTTHARRTRDAEVDVDLIERLDASVEVPLVLHGSSGLSDDQLSRALAAGIRKVNIGTALNVAAAAPLRADLLADPSVVDPRRYGRAAREATVRAVEHYCLVIAQSATDRALAVSGDAS